MRLEILIGSRADAGPFGVVLHVLAILVPVIAFRGGGGTCDAVLVGLVRSQRSEQVLETVRLLALETPRAFSASG